MPNVKTLTISDFNLKSFITQLSNHIDVEGTLDVFNDRSLINKTSELASGCFDSEIDFLHSVLKNDGIVALDFPEIDNESAQYSATTKTAVMLGLFGQLGHASFSDRENLPMSIHSAKHSDIDFLASVGSGVIHPGTKLGFHNDGLLIDGQAFIPNHIGLMNLYIGYRETGKFYWVNSEDLNIDLEELKTRYSVNAFKPSVIELSPAIYVEENGETEVDNENTVNIPIIGKSKNGIGFFLNGKVTEKYNDAEKVKLFSEIKNNIENCSNIFEMEQREGRIIFFQNNRGFHARDIFESPFEGIDLSRVMLRIVDNNVDRCAPMFN